MLYKLEDICTLITDGSHFSPEDEGIGYPMLSVKDMGDDDFDFGSCKHVGEAAYQKLVTNGCKPLVNDVVVAKDGSYLKTAFPITEDRDIALLSSIAILRPKISVVDPTYLSYYLKSKEVYRTVSLNYISGTALKRVILKGIKKIPIVLPDLHEQQFRADLLKKLNRIMRSRKQELQMLDDLIKARFVEMFGDPITNTKGIETKDLKDVLLLKAGDFTAASDISDTPTEEYRYPCYGGNGVRGYVAEYNQEGDYSLIGRQGALSGNVQYATGRFKNTEHALLVTPIITINSIWLNKLLINLDLKRYQTGAAQPGLSVKNLQEIQIISVPIEEQNRFAEFVVQVDKSKAAVQKSLEEMQLLFDSLMQQYFG